MRRENKMVCLIIRRNNQQNFRVKTKSDTVKFTFSLQHSQKLT